MQVQSGFEFTMDANANRSLIKRVMPLAAPAFPVQNATYSYNADNQLTAATGRTFGYDNNGNMVTIAGTNPATFAYNQLNQLTQYTAGSTSLAFQDDVLGNRIRKTSGSTTTKYIPAVGGSASGAITAYYIYGLGLVSKIEGSSAYYYQYDGIGSTVAITDTTGAIKNKYAYNDFGQLATNATETVANPFKYVGKYGVQTDAPDLLYMRARYYMPSLGRFINKDPLGMSIGHNRYLYVHSNPIMFIDPKGTEAISITATTITIIIAYISSKYGPEIAQVVADLIGYYMRRGPGPEGYPGQNKGKMKNCQNAHPPLLNGDWVPEPGKGDDKEKSLLDKIADLIQDLLNQGGIDF